jgi:hypothetical protein
LQLTIFQPKENTMQTLERKPETTARPLLDDSERTRCEIWTRVMGYHRPVSSFNTGKQGEFNERRFFVESQHA